MRRSFPLLRHGRADQHVRGLADQRHAPGQTVKDGESAAYPALFGVLTAGSAYAVFAVWRTSVVIPAPKRVAAAVIVSSVIAIANFGYQNLFQPYQRQTQPLITVSMGKPVLSKDRKAFAVPVDITLRNRSDVGLLVLGTEFHAMGKHGAAEPEGPAPPAVASRRRAVERVLGSEPALPPGDAPARRVGRGKTLDAPWKYGRVERHLRHASGGATAHRTRRTTRWRSMPPRASRARTGSCCSRRSTSWRTPGVGKGSPDG